MNAVQHKNKANMMEYLIIALLWFSAFVKFQSPSLNPIALYGAIPFAVVLCIIRWGISCKENIYICFLFLIYGWCLITSMTSIDIAMSLTSMKAMMGAAMLSFIFFKVSYNIRLIPFLYATFIILYVSAWLYAKDNILVMSEFDISSSRMNDEMLNANHMAYFTFFITIIIYIYGLIYDGKLGKFYKLLLWGLLPLSFGVSIFTASRQVLVLQIPLLCILIYKRYFSGKQSFIRVLLILLIIIFSSVFLYDSIMDIYGNSMLAKRSEESVTEDIRFLLLQEATKVGFEHFLFGVGPACTTHVLPGHLASHCTYTELFACSGFLAPLLYVMMLCKFIKKQLRLYRFTKDEMYWIFLIFGCFYVFDNFFYMFHYDLWLISFFILVGSYSIRYNSCNDLKHLNCK